MSDDAGDAGSRRAERRSRRQDLSRTQLLDAAEEMFGRRGFYETTLKEVADRAEFSVGSVYSFFADKEDLYLHVFLRRGADFLPALRQVVAGEGDARRQLHDLAEFEVGYFRAHPHFARLYLRSVKVGTAPPTASSVDEALRGNFEEAMSLQAAVFARGQAQGVLRAGDPMALAHLFSGLVAAYQSLDPAVAAEGGPEGPADPPALSLDDLHAIIDGAFT